MALEGTLQDFALADIFQLITIQQKTGVLSLKDVDDDVSVYFREGNIVFADSTRRNVEDRIGRMLVRSGKITEEQLESALQTQKSTLQRLGNILVEKKHITSQELSQALELQVAQIVQRLFRWTRGDYRFRPEQQLDLDQDHSTLISSQSILMDSVRMIDEWPRLERRIPSLNLVFEKCDGGAALEVLREEDDLDLNLMGDGDLDLDLDLAAEPDEEEGEGEAAIKVSPGAAQLFELVNGRANVEELVDSTQLGEFDTCRGLYELLEHGVIRQLSGSEPTPAAEETPTSRKSGSALLWLGYLVLMAGVSLSLLTMGRNPVNLVPLPLDESPTVDAFRRLVSSNRVERVDRALYLYFLENHRFAGSLDDLVNHGFLEPGAIVDPWGRTYGYEVLSNGYRLVGFDNGGVEDESMGLKRRFPSGLLPPD